MARKIEFDRQKARSAALQLFWGQGYTATSMAQLLAVMGVGQSSFYAAFGSKRDLYRECLETFYLRTRRALERSLGANTASAVVADFFRATMLDVPAKDRVRGCLMVNTVLELRDVDDDLSLSAAGYLEEIRSLLELRFVGEEENGVDRKAAARLATATMVANFGLRVASRTGMSRTQLAGTIDGTLETMGIFSA